MQDTVKAITKNHFQDWQQKLARELLNDFDTEDHNIIDALHYCQNIFGYIDRELIPLLARLFNLSRAEVQGVVSFYPDFREQKPGAYIVKICQAESCQALGSDKLTADIKRFLGLEFHQTSSESDITLEPVYCLGNCSCSPNVMINSRIFSRVESEPLTLLLQQLIDS